jgi:hypothetical protein
MNECGMTQWIVVGRKGRFVAWLEKMDNAGYLKPHRSRQAGKTVQ